MTHSATVKAVSKSNDDVSSFPHENSRNKNYDNHNFFSFTSFVSRLFPLSGTFVLLATGQRSGCL